ncbi:MAG: ribosomal RNA small subunit methyltransferase A [Candidatus Magasanikbacteria bacterium]|jgi:16S rRNA (adenine1518-N6/adenine1519-N6)-dimethyltransferase|nr:ribosomal RNA small subunit methyltransferase A [Candidatus Magasanikbacteria bacterium]
MIHSPKELKELCAKYSLTPSKQYGQHYLISETPIHKMVEAAGIEPGDTVVEVGPGFGILTTAVAEKAGRVMTFEIEKKLAPYWEVMGKTYPNVEVIWGNVLTQFDRYAHTFPPEYIVVANLPYQITSQAIRIFLESAHPPKRMVVMIQKEVAERIVAKPSDMSVLSVSVQYFGTPRIVTKVSGGSFWPIPKVDSAVIAIDHIHAQPKSEEFFRIVRAGFHNKRKQLWRNLADALSIPKERVQEVLLQVKQNEKVRAEEVSVEEWRRIVELLSE